LPAHCSRLHRQLAAAHRRVLLKLSDIRDKFHVHQRQREPAGGREPAIFRVRTETSVRWLAKNAVYVSTSAERIQFTTAFAIRASASPAVLPFVFFNLSERIRAIRAY
jgi:hypothetical protein